LHAGFVSQSRCAGSDVGLRYANELDCGLFKVVIGGLDHEPFDLRTSHSKRISQVLDGERSVFCHHVKDAALNSRAIGFL
jgi:hypothetical protein